MYPFGRSQYDTQESLRIHRNDGFEGQEATMAKGCAPWKMKIPKMEMLHIITNNFGTKCVSLSKDEKFPRKYKFTQNKTKKQEKPQ